MQDSGDGPDAAGGGRRAALPAALLARFSRRTLAILAVVIVALVVAAVVLATAASGGSDRDNAGQQPGSSAGTSDKGGSQDAGSGKADSSPSEAADGAADRDKGDSKGEGKDDEGGGADDGGADDGGGDGGSKESKLPDGFTSVADGRFGFRMGLPDGWKRTGVAGQNSGAKYGSSNGSLPKVQVDHNSSPQSDAAKTWRQLEPAVRGSSTGYDLIGIDKVGWRGYPTVADWKFTRKENGQRVRVLNRGFRVDGSHGYAIMITCKASEWDGKECRQLRDTAFKTFKPTG